MVICQGSCILQIAKGCSILESLEDISFTPSMVSCLVALYQTQKDNADAVSRLMEKAIEWHKRKKVRKPYVEHARPTVCYCRTHSYCYIFLFFEIRPDVKRNIWVILPSQFRPSHENAAACISEFMTKRDFRQEKNWVEQRFPTRINF